MKPPSLLDPAFRYTQAPDTDLRKTFARIRWEMAKAGIEPRVVKMPTLVADVLPIVRRVA